MSNQTIVLSESTGAQTGYAPLTLTLNPSGYSITDGPIVKIAYNFNDGTDPTVVKRRITVDSSLVSAYAFPDDPGDPRNVLVEHSLFPSVSGDPQIFNLEVSVTKATTFTPIVYEVPISVFKVDAINGLEQGFFGDIHLIGLRAHGDSNIKVMAFETANPRYVTFLTYNDEITNRALTPTNTPTPTPTSTPTPTPTPTTSGPVVDTDLIFNRDTGEGSVPVNNGDIITDPGPYDNIFFFFNNTDADLSVTDIELSSSDFTYILSSDRSGSPTATLPVLASANGSNSVYILVNLVNDISPPSGTYSTDITVSRPGASFTWTLTIHV